LNRIAVGIFAVADEKHFALADLPESCASRYQLFAQGGDILGVKHDLRSLASRRRWAGMQRDTRTAGGKLAPAFLLGNLLQAEDFTIEFAHGIHLPGK
jgi:hypothetical protein